jgi:hypothetical protein
MKDRDKTVAAHVGISSSGAPSHLKWNTQQSPSEKLIVAHVVKKSRPLLTLKFHCHVHKSLPSYHILSSVLFSSSYPTPLIVSSNPCLSLQNCLFLKVSRLKLWMHFSSPWLYLKKSTNYKAPHYQYTSFSPSCHIPCLVLLSTLFSKHPQQATCS